MLNLTAFHDYDIRGIYPTEINEEFFYKLGQAVATYIGKGPIAVGADARLSSPSLSKSLTYAILEAGLDVVSLGAISTEMHSFASGFYDFEANIIVSASHNPAEYNGAKIVKKGVVPLHGDFGLDKIRELMQENNFVKGEKRGIVTKKNVMSDWITHVLSFIDISKLKKIKVVVDTGNGMAGPTWQKLSQKLVPVEIIPLYFEPDGRFPNHHPDPLKDENIVDLKRKMVEEKADIGLAFDGDADRIFFMDETGAKITGTVAAAILADYLLSKEKGAVLFNVIVGRAVKETVERRGGRPVRTRVGHSFIKEAMKKESGLLGAEHSGHFYFGKNFYADSATIAGLLMLEILSKSETKLSELKNRFDIYPQSGELNFTVTDRQNTMDHLLNDFSNAENIEKLDGITFWYKNYWFNIRDSKTEPLLRLNIEADNFDILNQKTKELIEKLLSLGAKQKT